MAIKFSSNKSSSLLAIVSVFLILAIGTFFYSRSKSASMPSSSSAFPKKVDINQTLEFPLGQPKEGSIDPVPSMRFTVTKAELSKQIVIKGQNATAIEGRAFLIVTLKLENPTSSSFAIKTRDFLRLVPANSEDKLAPDIHNDPTEVQAISTKITRVGFPVDDNQSQFKLLVGEINGDKQELDLSF